MPQAHTPGGQAWAPPAMVTASFPGLCASNCHLRREGSSLTSRLSAHPRGLCYHISAAAIHGRGAGSTLPPEMPAEEPAQGQEQGAGHRQQHHKPGFRLPERLRVSHKPGRQRQRHLKWGHSRTLSCPNPWSPAFEPLKAWPLHPHPRFALWSCSVQQRFPLECLPPGSAWKTGSPHPPRASPTRTGPGPLTVALLVLVATVLALQGTRCTMTVAVVLRWGAEGPASATRIKSS